MARLLHFTRRLLLCAECGIVVQHALPVPLKHCCVAPATRLEGEFASLRERSLDGEALGLVGSDATVAELAPDACGAVDHLLVRRPAVDLDFRAAVRDFV